MNGIEFDSNTILKDFKGFEYNVGDKRYRFNVKDVDKQTIDNDRKPGQVGNYFKQNFDARKLLPREGDFILEGRFGNSIRFGSDLINENTNYKVLIHQHLLIP